jgi:hypothetical protein
MREDLPADHDYELIQQKRRLLMTTFGHNGAPRA